MKPSHRLAVLASPLLAMLGAAGAARADTVVQIPIDSLLDARPVSTLTGGVVVPWTAGQGVDGDGNSDGYITEAVNTKLGYTGVALPDDGVFPASATTGAPEIDLHFANANPATSFQAHNVKNGAAETFHFAVPQATYSMIYLLMTSSEGAEVGFMVTMTYSDTTTSVTTFTLPDYGTGDPLPTNPPIYFNLISGMHKWTTTDQQTDNPIHTITGVKVTPTATKELVDIALTKPMGGQYLVFWGATGIATSAVDAGVSAGDAEAEPDATTSEEAGNNGSSTSSGGSSSGSTGGSSGSSGGPSDAAGVGATDAAASPDAGETAAHGSSGCGCSLADTGPATWPSGVLLAACGAAVRRRRTRRISY